MYFGRLKKIYTFKSPNYMKVRLTLLLLFALLVVSCKKENAGQINIDFIGYWTHIEEFGGEIRYKNIRIQENSKGDIYYSDGWNITGATQTRKWLIKNDYLYFGWTANGNEKFKINQYPTYTDTLFINGIDTVQPGNFYMVLDNSFFYK